VGAPYGYNRRGPAEPGRSSVRSEDYDRVARVEQQNWWFEAKRLLTLRHLAGNGAGPPSRVADVGCGTGATAEALLGAGVPSVVALDASPEALAHTVAAHPSVTAVSAVAEALPIRDGALDAVVSLDVIEHLDDDVAALSAYRNALRPDGRVVIAVPAYQWAWSDHDERLGHRRRYTARRLRRSLETAGFRVEKLSYFHSFLVPAVLVARKTPLGRLVNADGGAGSTGSTADRVFRVLSRWERSVLRIARLPFGLSVLAVGVKRAVPDPRPAPRP